VGFNPTQSINVRYVLCVHTVFVLSCVKVEALRQAGHSSKKSYRLQNDHDSEKSETRT
jgi:hypothetical protein